MTVKKIVKAYLQANGYTGLVNGDVPCGCEISDLMPCDSEDMANCKPGYKHLCRRCPAKKDCEVEGGHNDGGEWCISISKDTPKAEV